MTVAFLVYYFSIFSLLADLWTLSRSDLQLPEYAYVPHIALRGMCPIRIRMYEGRRDGLGRNPN
jgi:hypothetical protein